MHGYEIRHQSFQENGVHISSGFLYANRLHVLDLRPSAIARRDPASERSEPCEELVYPASTHFRLLPISRHHPIQRLLLPVHVDHCPLR